MTGPAEKNSFDKTAKPMKIGNQMDHRDFGKKVKAKARTVVVKSSGKDGKVYSYRTIMTKESCPLLTSIVEAEKDITLLPEKVINEIKKLIKKGAVDLEQKWVNALELLHTAYKSANVKRPTPNEKGAWNQYEDLIAFSVRQLAATRGIDNQWRIAPVVLREASQPRFIADIPGAQSVEVEGDSIHQIIDSITNKLKRQSVHAKVEKRDQYSATLSVWSNDVKHYEINIRDISHH